MHARMQSVESVRMSTGGGYGFDRPTDTTSAFAAEHGSLSRLDRDVIVQSLLLAKLAHHGMTLLGKTWSHE
jgi:hypothetical protein